MHDGLHGGDLYITSTLGNCSSSRQSSAACIGLGTVTKLGPKTGGRVKEGQRVVAVPWPTAGGEGTYQQYVATPEKNLVKYCAHGLSISHLCHPLCLLLQVVVPNNVDDDMAAQFLVTHCNSQFSCKQYTSYMNGRVRSSEMLDVQGAF